MLFLYYLKLILVKVTRRNCESSREASNRGADSRPVRFQVWRLSQLRLSGCMGRLVYKLDCVAQRKLQF